MDEKALIESKALNLYLETELKKAKKTIKTLEILEDSFDDEPDKN